MCFYTSRQFYYKRQHQACAQFSQRTARYKHQNRKTGYFSTIAAVKTTTYGEWTEVEERTASFAGSHFMTAGIIWKETVSTHSYEKAAATLRNNQIRR